MTTSKLGPHVIRPSAPALLWAARAPIVKALDDTTALRNSPLATIRVFRKYFPEQDINRRGHSVVLEVLSALGSAPATHLELFNETAQRLGQGLERYVEFTREAVEFLKTVRPDLTLVAYCFSTGNPEADDWGYLRAHRYGGAEVIGLHEYFGWQGLTPWNALRHRTVHAWTQGDHPKFLITECGRDKVEGGHGGWHADELAESTYLAELLAYEAKILKDPYVLAATPFTSGPTTDWKNFDMDPLAARLAVLAGPLPKEDPMTDQPTLCTMAMWRQGNDLRPEQRTFAGLADALTAGGFTVAVADVLQGTTPQADFSKTAIDIWGPSDAAHLATYLKGRGVRFWPMQNVLGEDIPAEVAALKTYADAIRESTGESTIVLDFEAMYPQFFEPSGDLDAAIEELVVEVDRVFTPGRWTVILCPDPRQIGREYALGLFPKHWVLMLQTYNKDFGTSWQECYRRYLPAGATADLANVMFGPTNAAASNYGGRTVIPMLQGDLSTLEMRGIWTWLAQHSRWACVWGFGALVPETTPGALDDFEVARAVAGPYEALPVSVPVNPVPEPVPTPSINLPKVSAALDDAWSLSEHLVALEHDSIALGLQEALVQIKEAVGLQAVS